MENIEPPAPRIAQPVIIAFCLHDPSRLQEEGRCCARDMITFRYLVAFRKHIDNRAGQR
jgi:hypothetical protein